MTNAKFFAPLHKGLRSSLQGYAVIVASIVLLFLLSSPAAITRLVVAGWVYTVQRVVRRWLVAHVGIKLFKRTPFVTNQNSLRSILAKACRITVFTAGKHCVPCVIYRRLAHAMRHGGFIGKSQTSARLAAPIFNIRRVKLLNGPAIALAEPHTIMVSSAARFNEGQFGIFHRHILADFYVPT